LNFPPAFSEKTCDDAEREFVEAALEMLPSQSAIDAERPGLGVGEAAEDPAKNGMRGCGDDDMELVPYVGATGIGQRAVGFDPRARGDVGGGEAMQRGDGEVLDRGQVKASGIVLFDLDRRQ
jgi:hypothetical protein